MLDELCQELKNWFVYYDDDKHIGTFTIQDGDIMPSIDLQENQYYRIVGSVFNDGIHQNNDNDELIDETFTGGIWLMRIPKTFLDLADEIEQWQKNMNESDTSKSPYQSESFGGYSYSKKSGANGNGYSWKDEFSSRLNMWRKV